MSEIIKFELAPTSKADRELMIQNVRDSILSGETNPIDADVALKGLEEVIDLIRKAIKPYVQDEAGKYGEKVFSRNGAEITKSERKSFDFSTCNDSLWNKLKDDEIKLSDARKKREMFLKSLPIEGVITPDGEVISAPSFTIMDILTIKIL